METIHEELKIFAGRKISEIWVGKKILVVDDDIAAGETLAEFLRIWEMVPILARDAEEASCLYINHAPDLAIVDQRLPEVSGIEWIEKILMKDPLFPAILISAAGRLEHLAQIKGIKNWLKKPLDYELLQLMIKKIFKEKNGPSPAGDPNLNSPHLLHASQGNEDDYELTREKELNHLHLMDLIHEMVSPIFCLNHYTARLQQFPQLAEDSKAQELLLKIIQQGEKLSQLTQKMREYSQLNLDPKNLLSEKTDLNRVLNELEENLSGIISEQNGTLERKGIFPTSLSGNPSSFNIILRNLITNSLFYTNTSPQIILTGTIEENFWKLQVQDNGIGIDKKEHEKIFMQFVRLHRTMYPQGFGQGLYIVKKLVKLLGGTMSVDSKLGEGTTFTLTFPLDS